MNKLVASYMVIFVIFAWLSSVMEGAGGTNATQLNGNISATTTTITVDSTQGFLDADSIIIEDEEIAYSGRTAVAFTGCTRAYNNTDAEFHNDNINVYSRETGVFNRAMGFNVISTGEAYGTMAVVNTTWTFLTKALGYLVSFNFSFLTGELVYVRYLMMAPAVGLVIYFGVMAISTAFGIIRRSL